MTEQLVVAPDMRSALKSVKEQFGEDALILDTRSRRLAKEGSLRLEEEIEVRVMVPDRDPGGRLIEAPAGDAGPVPGSLEAEIQRLESLVGEFERQIEAHESRGRYPLRPALRELGLSAEAVDLLAADHAEEIPPFEQEQRAPALARLRHWLPCVEAMDVADLRGHHALLGAPGAGRSALARRLATHCAEAGGAALLIACAPEHPGERHRLEAEAQAKGYEAVLAPDERALLEAIEFLRGRDLVILDLPAFTTEQQALLERVELALGDTPLLRHLVLPADAHRPHALVAAAAPHYLAISRADLAEPLRVALEAGSRGAGRLSFLTAGSGEESMLMLMEPTRLLSGLAKGAPRAEAAEAGGAR